MSNKNNDSLRSRVRIQKIIEENNLDLLIRDGISIATVKDKDQGFAFTKDILYSLVDKNTVLFLSGGSTPKTLYQDLAKEKKLNLGAVAMVDERYGKQNHTNSNERMIGNTGLLLYLKKKNIPFYRILRVAPSTPSASTGALLIHPKGVREYEKVVGDLLKKFKIRIAIMGIGNDGHTAGLPARTQNSIPDSIGDKTQNYVTHIYDFPGEFKERVTLTFKALSKMDLLLVLVFGSAKQKALDLMFENGSDEQIPARFYTKSEIADKTLLITDQKL